MLIIAVCCKNVVQNFVSVVQILYLCTTKDIL